MAETLRLYIHHGRQVNQEALVHNCRLPGSRGNFFTYKYGGGANIKSNTSKQRNKNVRAMRSSGSVVPGGIIGHPEGWFFMVQEIVHFHNKNKNINTKSSTETVLVGVRKYLPLSVWCVNYMGSQGWTIKKYRLHKDKNSSIIM